MNDVYVELRTLDKGVSLSWDIVRHLYTRQLEGIILIVDNRPRVLLASVRKQWVKSYVGLDKERASTLHADRLRHLKHISLTTRSLDFKIGLPSTEATQGVFFISPEEAALAVTSSVRCRTLYVVDIATEPQYKLVVKHGLVVVYRLATQI